MKGLFERARKIYEQHHAIAFRVIPDFVIVRIIKDERFAFRPVTEIIADADANFFMRFRYEQAEVKT